MAKQKIQSKLMYTGLGFPVLLKNIPMIELRGVWTPDVNLNLLQKTVILALAHHAAALTGNQVYFIRTWLGLTQAEFGARLGVTAPAVVKWEKYGDNEAKISLITEREIRLLALDILLCKDEDFRNAFRFLHGLQFTGKTSPICLDATTDLVAI